MPRPTPAQVRAQYDQIADRYDSRYESSEERFRARAIDSAGLRLAERAHRVLELGCGTGRLLAQARGPVRIALDLSLRMLQHASSKGLTSVCADAHQLPFANASFDLVLAGKGVFRYLDMGTAFAECTRILGPNGHLVVHQYARRTWAVGRLLHTSSYPGESMHLGHLDELLDPARRVGLVVESVELWRTLRFYPYVLSIPRWLPGSFWSQCTVVFRRN